MGLGMASLTRGRSNSLVECRCIQVGSYMQMPENLALELTMTGESFDVLPHTASWSGVGYEISSDTR